MEVEPDEIARMVRQLDGAADDLATVSREAVESDCALGPLLARSDRLMREFSGALERLARELEDRQELREDY